MCGRHLTTKTLTLADIKERILNVCKAYDKINADKVTNHIFFKLLQNALEPLKTQKRLYSEKEPLTLELIRERILLVLRLYDKINPEKVQ